HADGVFRRGFFGRETHLTALPSRALSPFLPFAQAGWKCCPAWVAAAPRRVCGSFARVLGLVLFVALGCRIFAGPLDWDQQTGFRSAKVTVPQRGKPGFTQLTNIQLGIHFTNILTFQRASLNHNLLNGAGVAA